MMKNDVTSRGFREEFSLRPDLLLHVADFTLHEPKERSFASTSPLLRFYFHIEASGYWELKSPHRKPSEQTIGHRDRFSMVFFYSELEGKMHVPAGQRQFHLSIHLMPSLLHSYLGGCFEDLPNDLRAITEGCAGKGFAHSGPLCRSMTAAIGRLLDSPYTGAMKRLYMESKAIELIAHKLAQLGGPGGTAHTRPRMRSEDIDRVRYAKEILCRDLECPPKLSELARALGTNHSALNKGFREIYGTTVFGCLRQMRLIEARRMIEEEGKTVTETALTVGYNSVPSFSRAFLDFFGSNPTAFLKRKGHGRAP
ncbi:MAG: AraC family transcriptional regulator [Thermodesulfobacteriota bacterium]